ncbi:MAG: hypothetical protein R3C18_23370 [Planctomycetaceae bacterium]
MNDVTNMIEDSVHIAEFEDLMQLSDDSLVMVIAERINAHEGKHSIGISFHAAAKLWKSLRSKAQSILCTGDKPKEWVNDLIVGDMRNLVVNITTVLVSQLELSVGVAVPIAALLLKRGAINICSGE